MTSATFSRVGLVASANMALAEVPAPSKRVGRAPAVARNRWLRPEPGGPHKYSARPRSRPATAATAAALLPGTVAASVGP